MWCVIKCYLGSADLLNAYSSVLIPHSICCYQMFRDSLVQGHVDTHEASMTP
jgi:hypothetical protein